MTTLTLNGLRKTFPGAGSAVLHGLDLAVPSGSLTALLGPSGSGKTTAMKLVAGLEEPEAGDILLDGQPITALPPDRRGVVMVFQEPHLFAHLTVAQNLGFGLRMRGVAPDIIARETAAMLDRVQLTGLGQRRPHELSGGQAQRVALARALVLRPRVLLLDEPLSNLDASLRDEMRALIAGLQRETGITTLVVTHDQTEAVVLADHIALLLDGRLAQHGTPAALFHRPASEAVARFFGGVNFIDGTAEGAQVHSALGSLDLSRPARPGAVRLTLRPEAIRLGAGPNARQATVRDIAFLGSQSRVVLDLGPQVLTALLPPVETAGLSSGQNVTLSLPPDQLWPLPDRG